MWRRDVVLVWGTSWRALQSNVYRAAFAASDLESGTGAWFYYSGNGRWSREEKDAAGLLASDDASHPSVVWNEALERFVMLRGAQGGRIVAQFSTAPWGPLERPDRRLLIRRSVRAGKPSGRHGTSSPRDRLLTALQALSQPALQT